MLSKHDIRIQSIDLYWDIVTSIDWTSGYWNGAEGNLAISQGTSYIRIFQNFMILFCLYWEFVASIDWISGYWDIKVMSKVGCGFVGCHST